MHDSKPRMVRLVVNLGIALCVSGVLWLGWMSCHGPRGLNLLFFSSTSQSSEQALRERVLVLNNRYEYGPFAIRMVLFGVAIASLGWVLGRISTPNPRAGGSDECEYVVAEVVKDDPSSRATGSVSELKMTAQKELPERRLESSLHSPRELPQTADGPAIVTRPHSGQRSIANSIPLKPDWSLYCNCGLALALIATFAGLGASYYLSKSVVSAFQEQQIIHHPSVQNEIKGRQTLDGQIDPSHKARDPRAIANENRWRSEERMKAYLPAANWTFAGGLLGTITLLFLKTQIPRN